MGTQRRTWLTRTLVLLTLVSLLQDAASELLYPLLPLLLTGVLAAPPVVLGVIEGLADATAGVTKYVSGRWSDRRGRKPFITAGYGFAAVGKVLVAAAGSWPVVLIGRVVDRFGKGVRSAPRDALIAADVPPEARGRAFGFHRMGDSAGAVIGPLLGLLASAGLKPDEVNIQSAGPAGVWEFLATGKVIVSNNITTYDGPDPLFRMCKGRDDNAELPGLFREVVDNIAEEDSFERQSRRITFAKNNTYDNQVKGIDAILVSMGRN